MQKEFKTGDIVKFARDQTIKFLIVLNPKGFGGETFGGMALFDSSDSCEKDDFNEMSMSWIIDRFELSSKDEMLESMKEYFKFDLYGYEE